MRRVQQKICLSHPRRSVSAAKLFVRLQQRPRSPVCLHIHSRKRARHKIYANAHGTAICARSVVFMPRAMPKNIAKPPQRACAVEGHKRATRVSRARPSGMRVAPFFSPFSSSYRNWRAPVPARIYVFFFNAMPMRANGTEGVATGHAARGISGCREVGKHHSRTGSREGRSLLSQPRAQPACRRHVANRVGVGVTVSE